MISVDCHTLFIISDIISLSNILVSYHHQTPTGCLMIKDQQIEHFTNPLISKIPLFAREKYNFDLNFFYCEIFLCFDISIMIKKKDNSFVWTANTRNIVKFNERRRKLIF